MAIENVIGHLDDLSLSLLVFPSRTHLKLHEICVSPKMVKKIITYLDSSKVSGPNCIPVVSPNFHPY